jgi:hypothetical protein
MNRQKKDWREEKGKYFDDGYMKAQKDIMKMIDKEYKLDPQGLYYKLKEKLKEEKGK